MHVEVPALRERDLAEATRGETSAAIRTRVEVARRRQLNRQGLPNAQLGVAEIERYCLPSPAAGDLLRQATSRLALSARGYHRVLKLARTIADLVGIDHLGVGEVAEALQYRPSQLGPPST